MEGWIAMYRIVPPCGLTCASFRAHPTSLFPDHEKFENEGSSIDCHEYRVKRVEEGSNNVLDVCSFRAKSKYELWIPLP
jgi:hypothetical protein